MNLNVYRFAGLILVFVLNLQQCGAQVQINPDLIQEKIPGSEETFSLKLIPSGKLLLKEDAKTAILDSFYIGTHEVTHDLFVLFKRKEFDTEASDLSSDYTPDAVTRPSPPYEDLTWGMGNIGGFPAVSMTQQAALKFCRWLYLKTGRFYRLPTEAEWTYVALHHLGDSNSGIQVGWFEENSDSKFHKVGQVASQNGIYDMYGNVLEWTMDYWKEGFLSTYQENEINNPWVVPTKKNYRVLKGGSFYDASADVTAWTRFKSERKWQERDPQIPKSLWWLTDGSFVGFRVVSPVEQPNAEEISAFFEQAIVE